jgi:hypothetical protein
VHRPNLHGVGVGVGVGVAAGTLGGTADVGGAALHGLVGEEGVQHDLVVDAYRTQTAE